MRPELLLLPEHGSNLKGKLLSLFDRVNSQHLHPPAVRIKNTRQHFNRRALSRPIGPDKGKDLALIHRKRHAVHRLNFLCPGIENCPDTALHSLFLPLHPKGF